MSFSSIIEANKYQNFKFVFFQIIFALFFVTAVTAQPVPDNDPHKEIKTLYLKYDRNPAGSYDFR